MNGQPEKKVNFDPTINLGHILTMVVVLTPVLVWGLRLEGRVDLNKQSITYLERVLEQQRADLHAVTTDIKGALLRIEAKIDGKVDK